MTEKVAMSDILSSVNALIKQCEFAIEQSNDKNQKCFRKYSMACLFNR